MTTDIKIDINLLKVISRTISRFENIDMMTAHLCQLMIGTLDIKGAAILALNIETDELEPLGSSGLSVAYVNKGPLMFDQSLGTQNRRAPVVISDIAHTDLLQYPRDAHTEGVRAIVSLPITVTGRLIGMLRLYHHDVWQPSDEDLDTLQLVADHIGLTLSHTRLVNVCRVIKHTVSEVHEVWLSPD